LLFVGFSTLLVGLLTGTFFGNLVKFLPDSLNFVKEFLKRFVIIDTMNAKGSLMFLGFSLAFGYVQLCFGLILKIALMIRDKKYKDLILDGLSAFCMQISLLPISLYYILDFKFFPPFAMNIFLGMFLISVVLIAVKEWINNEGIMVKIFWCLYGNYSAITGTFLSDTLSYARLFALGLSGGLLGLAINEIASVFGAIPVIGIILMILVMIGGHIFNLGVSGLGSFVHSCRLQYLEFFTKFFEASGREMQPFCHENKYIEIEKN
jgi:V/A-type H+/Na+-transporting ATPase subunit I